MCLVAVLCGLSCRSMFVYETGALQQVGLSRLVGLTFSGDLGLFLTA